MAILKHVVLLRVRDDAPTDDVAWALAEIPRLVGVVPGLLDCAIGVRESAGGGAESFTHGFVMTFDSAEARDHYHPHPANERIRERLAPLIEGALLFDFLEVG